MLRTMRQQTSALSQRRVGYDVRKLDPRITTALCDDIERLQFANAAASGDWAGEPLAAMAAISAFVSKASEAVDQAHSGLHTLVQRMTSCLRQSCQVANARYICMGCATRYCSLRCQRLVRTHSHATTWLTLAGPSRSSGLVSRSARANAATREPYLHQGDDAQPLRQAAGARHDRRVAVGQGFRGPAPASRRLSNAVAYNNNVHPIDPQQADGPCEQSARHFDVVRRHWRRRRPQADSRSAWPSLRDERHRNEPDGHEMRPAAIVS